MVFSKEWYKENPHPRSMLGKRHSKETKAKMSAVRKGRKLPKEWCENISKGKTGIPRSAETKKKISKTRLVRSKAGLYKYRIGKNNNLWQGGKNTEHNAIRKSKEYRWWRDAVFGRDNYTCQMCGKQGGYLQVDHMKSFAHHPELRFKMSNGRTLCLKCHRKTDNFGWKAKPSEEATLTKVQGGDAL